MYNWVSSANHILIDSGAYTELNSGVKIELEKYKEWSIQWKDRAIAIAGLDDISGNWRQSYKNFLDIPWGFPTWHDTDPKECLKDLIVLAQERKQWLGIGLKPPRQGKSDIVKWFLDQVPPELHIHGWALQIYESLGKFNSFDSTNWWSGFQQIIQNFPWLTPGEAVEIQIKKYRRRYGKHIDSKIREQVLMLNGFGISKKEITVQYNLTEKEFNSIVGGIL